MDRKERSRYGELDCKVDGAGKDSRTDRQRNADGLIFLRGSYVPMSVTTQA
jgi:hypothetical protein